MEKLGRSAGGDMTSERKIAGDRKVAEVKIIRGKGGAPRRYRKRPKLEFVRIVRARGGGPIRTIVQAVKGTPTGTFVSLKVGLTLPWESVAERFFMWICEALWSVRAFMAQPFRMDFHMSDGTVIAYIPDFELVLNDGEVEIVAVKKDEKEISRAADYAFKIWLVRRVCKVRGWKFRVVTSEDEVGPGYLRENARHIRMNRFTTVTSEDFLRLGEAAKRSGGRMTWAEAVAALSRNDDPWSPNGVARLHALIVRRHVRVNISQRITQRTPVVLTESSAAKLIN
jgi:hypothetical protein